MAASMNELRTQPVMVDPPELGSHVRIWKQDPSVAPLHVRGSYVHGRINPGPSDAQITIQGVGPAFPDENNDFLFDLGTGKRHGTQSDSHTAP